ncbi:hypothetical protein F5Y04DRAFT_280018 [Hypomontagnella monticulosa]|nr:hypothetical protein F5Y04DRAFT_280018 [Hypomontagnella monticulosa]
MCRTILAHHMHHDVRPPMITDIESQIPVIHINPRHTCYHQCELSWESLGYWLLNTPTPTCPYHSCCALVVEQEFCSHFRDLVTEGDEEEEFLEDEFEPEECEYFVLEHRYERFEYLGYPREAIQILGEIPATWNEHFREVSGGWGSFFKRDRKLMAEWERIIFLACERLYWLEEDSSKHFLAYYDLYEFWPRDHPYIKAAEANVDRVQAKISEQKKQIYTLSAWAHRLPVEPPKSFESSWWLGIRKALESFTGSNNTTSSDVTGYDTTASDTTDHGE